ncbi:hypothetical protein KJ652_06200 [Patescibacteria group bacterium]|nr:hypothetical protein [Patescibacteria group bacterium]MBU1124143.1 hypothetical protein [Patescibacteria group bacterium]MBU1911760.1 hypothetical protein [Patescibacteria group bacterium]
MFLSRTLQPIKFIFVSIGALCLFAFAQNAFAVGGMLTVQQISNTTVLGTWVLTTPDGKTYADHRGEYIQKIEQVVGGTYSIVVNEPQKAKTSIVVRKSNNEIIRSVEGTHLSFTVAGGEAIRIEITYRYFGTITIDSEPSGQDIVLRGNNLYELKGVTPVTFTDVPPMYYSAEYGLLDECITPRKQSRVLAPNERIDFIGVYRCGDDAVFEEPEPEPRLPSPKLMNVSLQSNQNEVLPGGIVRYTLTVKNLDRTTHSNLLASVQFDPRKGYVSGVRDSGRIFHDDLLVWNVPTLYAGQTWTTRFNMQINDGLSSGHKITMTTRIEGSNLVEAGMYERELTHTVGVITILPATGWRADVLFILLLTAVSLPLAYSIRRRQFVVIKTV